MSRRPHISSQKSLLVIVRAKIQRTHTHQQKRLRKKTMQQQSSSGRENYCNFTHLHDKCWQLNVLTRLWKHQFCWSCATSDRVEPGRLVQQMSRSQLLHWNVILRWIPCGEEWFGVVRGTYLHSHQSPSFSGDGVNFISTHMKAALVCGICLRRCWAWIGHRS